MNEFVNTDKYGKLYIDRILFESGFPIIFTCKNDFNEIFICVCCQNNSYVYAVRIMIKDVSG